MTDDVETSLAGVPDNRRADARSLAELMTRATGEPPALWGSILGFGGYHYRYNSGREGNSMRVGFAPRKAALTIYLGSDRADDDALLARLGKYKLGKGCLYVKSLSDIDTAILEQLIGASYAENRARFPEDARR
jgi:hypothetical protein